MGMQKFSAKTLSGEHNRLGQASILAEPDLQCSSVGSFTDLFQLDLIF